MRGPGLYARTVLRLRPIQGLYLPLRRIQARLPARVRAPAARPAPERATSAALRIGVDGVAGVAARAGAVAERRFTFLGRTERLGEVDWRRRHVSHLWSYNLHYFDYARDLAWAQSVTGETRYGDAFAELAVSWVRGTDPGRGDGWEPYPTSLRIVNWIFALSLVGEGLAPGVRAELGDSLARQAAWLERRLEKHLQANHLQKNYLAMAVAGLFFDGPAAERWKERGLRGTWGAVADQVLSDGVHVERSPMYQCIVLADLLELLAFLDAAGEEAPAVVRLRVAAMLDALGALSRPDGMIHLFNDAAHGIAPSRAHLDRLGREMLARGVGRPDGAVALGESGYYAYLEDAGGERMVVDCGAPGPAYQPGHSHCDLLSFELDLAGRPVIVDSGVHGYAGDPYREYVRSTRAHNTVMVAGREQSEVWGTYRMGRMARVRRAGIVRAEPFRFEGSYSPYHDGSIVHERAISRGQDRWIIRDRILGGEGADVRHFFHLHPDFELRLDGERVVAESPDGMTVLLEPMENAGRMIIHRGERFPMQGWYCPGFGVARPAAVLERFVENAEAECERGMTIKVIRGRDE